MSICSSQIISSDLFNHLKQMHGSSYEAFMKSKLIPILGDIGEDNLGIESEISAKISCEIDVVISCAGRTTFDDRCLLCVLHLTLFYLFSYKQAICSNPSKLMQIRPCFKCQRSWTWSALELCQELQETETFSPFLNWYEFMFCLNKVIPHEKRLFHMQPFSFGSFF